MLATATARPTLNAAGHGAQMFLGAARMAEVMREHQERYDAAHLAWVAAPVGAPETVTLCAAKNRVMAAAFRAGVRVDTSHLPR